MFPCIIKNIFERGILNMGKLDMKNISRTELQDAYDKCIELLAVNVFYEGSRKNSIMIFDMIVEVETAMRNEDILVALGHCFETGARSDVDEFLEESPSGDKIIEFLNEGALADTLPQNHSKSIDYLIKRVRPATKDAESMTTEGLQEAYDKCIELLAENVYYEGSREDSIILFDMIVRLQTFIRNRNILVKIKRYLKTDSRLDFKDFLEESINGDLIRDFLYEEVPVDTLSRKHSELIDYYLIKRVGPVVSREFLAKDKQSGRARGHKPQ